MNKNLVKYPIRFGTLLLAGAALVACKKEEFTEKDAWNLENQRLTRLAQLKKTADSLARVEREGMFKWQRNIDSLNQINKGGRVFYTVIPVNANEAVLSGGRTEEAITGATVTATQFGRTVTGTGANGVFTFPEMRSGEVTVNVTAPNFTQVNYISNLTPDGGIANDGVVNVGNVIPMFELPGTGSNAAARFAVVRGQAWFEGDLTDATAQEERVTPAVLGTNTNLVTATIDLDRGAAGSTPSWFHRRFITETMDESGTGSIVGGTIRSGAIQRFSYSRAVSYGTVDANGAYSMLVPASASGLPIRLNYSEFAFNRVYFNTNGQTVNGTGTPAITERFLYGPNVTPTAIPTPTVSNPTLEVQAFTTAAAGTVAFTAQTRGATPTSFAVGTSGTSITTNAATSTGVAAINRRRGGFYATAPTVTTTAPGSTTAAVFTANLVDVASDATTDGSNLRNLTAAAYNGTNGTDGFTTATTNKSEFEGAFKTVGSVAVTSGGTGYTDGGSLTFTRTDFVTNAGFVGKITATSTGLVPLSSTTPIQVLDGGSGFTRNPNATVNQARVFTNYLPTPVFVRDAGTSASAVNGGYTTADGAIVPATARVFVDYPATYVNGNRVVSQTAPATGNGGVGSIQEVRLDAGGLGQYPASLLPFIKFSYGREISDGGNGRDGGNSALIGSSTSADAFEFNTGNITAAEATAMFGVTVASLTANTIEFTDGWGEAYTYLPKVTLVPSDALATRLALTNAEIAELAAINVRVVVFSSTATAADIAKVGKIKSLTIENQTISAALATKLAMGRDRDFVKTAAYPTNNAIVFKVTPENNFSTLSVAGSTNSLQTVATGSALDNYTVPNSTAAFTTTVSTLVAAVGGAKSNSATGDLSTDQYLAGNNLLVTFDAPTNVSAVGRKHAWGVPVFNGDVLAGIRILDGGSGYTSAPVGARLVPNPWFRTNVPVTGITRPSSLLTTSTTITGAANNQDIWYFLNHPTMTAQGSATLPSASVTRGRIVVTLTNPGAGYSKAPRFIVSGGGLNLVPFDNSAAPAGSTSSASPGGVLTLTSTIDAEGKVVKLTPETAGLTQVTSTTAGVTTDVLNTFQFETNKAPAYTGTLNLNVVEDLSVSLTRSLNNVAGAEGVGATVNVGATTAVPTGVVTNVRFGRTATAAATEMFLPLRLLTGTGATADADNDKIAPRVDIQTGTGSAVYVPGYDSPLVPGPRTIVVGGTGTGATVQSWVTLDPKVAQHRRITHITVTAGGTGYGFVRLNSVVRGLGGSIVPAGGDAQSFRIIGGAADGAGDYNNSFAQTNERFDAHPGRAYVRDVHYGTGVRVD